MSVIFDFLALVITLAIGVYGGLRVSLLLGKEGVETITGVGGSTSKTKTAATKAVAKLSAMTTTSGPKTPVKAARGGKK
jgi:hypothetical protein